MSKKKILILCPHPDDEIFTFPYFNSVFFSDSTISALFFTENHIRRKEAKRACLLNNWESIFAKELGYRFEDSLIHKNYEELNYLINKLFDKYPIILSPLIEGGHQDHDTVGYCVVKNMILRKSNQIYFYSTYSALGYLGFFSLMSNNNYAKGFFKETSHKFFHCPMKSLRYMFCVYRSQIKSWLLVLIPYLIHVIFRNYIKIYTLNDEIFDYENSFLDVFRDKPLYEIHGRCKKLNWVNSIR